MPSEISIPEDGGSVTFRNITYYAHTLFQNNLCSLIRSMFRVLIRSLKFIKKDQQMRFGFMNVILLYSDH